MEKKYPDRNHGKQTKQRLKPYIVLQYLLRNTDEEHFATGKDIEGYLREICDIYAERRSIYKDIDEINDVVRLHKTMHKNFFQKSLCNS